MLPLALIAVVPQIADVPPPFEPSLLPIRAGVSPGGRLIACDLEGDGVQEVVLVGMKGGVGIARGDGSGSLHLQSVPVPWDPLDGAVADLDQDGDEDIVLISASVLFLLENLGAGTFAPSTTVATGSFDALEVADLDGDGRLDLLTGTYSLLVGFRNVGPLDFEALPAATVDSLGKDFVAGDWNGDGLADLAFVKVGLAFVVSCLGDGLGGFQVHSQWASNGHPTGLKTGDLDGDGATDLVLLGLVNGTPYFRGTGGGSFLPTPAAAASLPVFEDAWVGDVDADGRPDAALASYERPLVDHAPLHSARTQTLPRAQLTAITGARLQRGRRLELVALVRHSPAGQGALLWNLARYRLEREHGLQGVLATVPRETDLASIHSGSDADLDGDGHLDRLLRAGSGVAFLRGGPAGWEPDPVALGFNAKVASTADVDGDGRPDVVHRASANAGWFVRFNEGSGEFSAPSFLATGLDVPFLGDGTPLLPDLNGDGRCDIAEVHGGFLTLYSGIGDGTFVPGFVAVVPGNTNLQDVLDIDGDGALDLVLWNDNAIGDQVYWFGDGHGGLRERMTAPTLGGERTRLVTAGDLDGDGDFELFTTTWSPWSGRLAVHPGLGGAAWGAPETYGIFFDLQRGLVTDMDDDGHTDLVTLAGSVGVLGWNCPEIWRGDGAGGLEVWSQPAWRTRHVTVHDVDGDGLPELIGDDAILRRPAR